MKREQLDGAGGYIPGLSHERTCLGLIFDDGLRPTCKVIYWIGQALILRDRWLGQKYEQN